MPAPMVSPRPGAELVPFVRVEDGARIYRLPGSGAGPATATAFGGRGVNVVRCLGALAVTTLVYAGVFAFAWLLVTGSA